MPLIKYTQYVFLPGGGPAVGFPVRVILTGGNQTPPLFSDKAGTAPMSSPVTTGPDGLLTFYAAPGNFQGHFAGEQIAIPVDDAETDAAWPDLFIHTQEQPSTVWTIQHHLGVDPAVRAIVDGSDSAVSDARHENKNTTVITFATPTAGVAQLRR